jgi:hypothetical protein
MKGEELRRWREASNVSQAAIAEWPSFRVSRQRVQQIEAGDIELTAAQAAEVDRRLPGVDHAPWSAITIINVGSTSTCNIERVGRPTQQVSVPIGSSITLEPDGRIVLGVASDGQRRK